MKKVLKGCISLLLASSLVLTGCSTSLDNNIQTNQQEVSSNSVENINKSDIFIEKNINVSIEKASLYGDKVQVASSFGQFTAKTSDLVKKSENVAINKLSPQLITLSDNDNKTNTPLALSVIANPLKAQSILISPQTTAEALVFMDPNVATTDLNFAEKVMNITPGYTSGGLSNNLNISSNEQSQYVNENTDEEEIELVVTMREIIESVDFEKVLLPKELNEKINSGDNSMLIRENNEVQEWKCGDRIYYIPKERISKTRGYIKN